MKRKFRHICSTLSLVIAMVAGVWMAVPRDICITKLMVSGGCVCLAEAGAGNGCVCCAEGGFGQKIPCDTHGETAGDNGKGEPVTHAPGCFSISSELSHMTGPERGPNTVPAFDMVVAFLPLPVDSRLDNRWEAVTHDLNKSALDGSLSYRDNCALLI